MSAIDWASLLLSDSAASECWARVFSTVCRLAVEPGDSTDLERELGRGDRLLADAGWDLWQDYAACIERAAHALEAWWIGEGASVSAAGRAVLILDALSVREMRFIASEAASKGTAPSALRVCGSEIPSDTAAFAQALGLRSRSQLSASGYPSSFVLAGAGLYTDVPRDAEFGQLAAEIPPSPDVVLWHPWLDDLIHAGSETASAARQLAATARRTLSGDGFWRLVERLRTGRRLLITSDHGYAFSGRFTELPAVYGDRLRAAFGAKRCGDLPAEAVRFADGQPSIVAAGTRAAAIGPWRWKVQGGFPQLSHGGLTLAEVCVPWIEFPPLPQQG